MALPARRRGSRPLKGRRGRPPSIVRSSSRLAPLELANQFTRIGGGLTPTDVSNIIREADAGNIYRLVDLGNEARQKDGHLQSLLGTREAALVGLKRAVEPFSTEAADVAVADFVRYVWAHATGRSDGEVVSFADLINHLSGALFYGYGVGEIDWVRDGGKIGIAGFRLVSARRFNYSISDGKLLFRDQNSGVPTGSGIALQDTYPDAFIQYQPRVTGDVRAREGLIRVLMWAALFRNWTLTDWLRLAELAWKPWRMGKYKQDASTEDIDDLYTALENLTSQGIGVFSDRAEIEVAWPERGRGGKPEHAVLAEYLGHEMSKCVLGQTLTIEPGERGARSLGEVHDRVRKDLREVDAIGVAAAITRDIIEPLVRLNFGPNVPLPTFEFVTDDTVDIGALSRAVEGLVRAGVKLKQEWVRDKFGAPDPEEGDDLCLGKEVLQAEQSEWVPSSLVAEDEATAGDANDSEEPDGPNGTADENADDQGDVGEGE